VDYALAPSAVDNVLYLFYSLVRSNWIFHGTVSPLQLQNERVHGRVCTHFNLGCQCRHGLKEFAIPSTILSNSKIAISNRCVGESFKRGSFRDCGVSNNWGSPTLCIPVHVIRGSRTVSGCSIPPAFSRM